MSDCQRFARSYRFVSVLLSVTACQVTRCSGCVLCYRKRCVQSVWMWHTLHTAPFTRRRRHRPAVTAAPPPRLYETRSAMRPTQPSQQPNSDNSDSGRPTRSIPKGRRKAGESGDRRAAALLAVNLHRFSERLTTAAAWRRGELPPCTPFWTCCWLAAIFIVSAGTAQ